MSTAIPSPEGTTAPSTEAALLAQLEAYFRRYAVLAPGLPLVLALWAVATHYFETLDAFPYLAITSPTKGCGKTRIAELLEMVCARPWRTVGATPAAIFRNIGKKKPTLIIDEAEILGTQHERAIALREILNAGYRQGQTVSRCDERKGYETTEFETYCPKALVLIGSLRGALADRCLEIRMQRHAKEEIERFRLPRVKAETKPLRDGVVAWAERWGKDVGDWYQNHDLVFLQDRDEELWLPLFATCAVLAPGRVPELRDIALVMAGTKEDGEHIDWGIRLLGDIRSIVLAKAVERISTRDLIEALRSQDESPYHGWNQGDGPTPRDIARLLKPFDISPRDLRMSEVAVVKGYVTASFSDAWERYLPPYPGKSATPLQGA